MVVGAYPSARFAAISGHRDVPVGDNMGPFEPERYFDGQRVRTQASADELKDLFFDRLNLDRSLCWVTDLVKVFLFKPGHRDKYLALSTPPPVGYERERFAELAQASVSWLEREIEASSPRLLVTLGSEVAGILRGVATQSQRNLLLSGTPSNLIIGSTAVKAVHLAHPGILMRKGDPERNPWPARHEDHLKLLKAELPALGLLV
jgi:uracil-DNA glycosylase